MKKTKYIIPIAALAISVFAIVSTVIAWYVTMNNAKDMSFSILQIDSLVSLYEGTDYNHNGAPDYLPSTNANKYYNSEIEDEDKYLEYTNMYYNEKYEFSYIDQRYALSQDSTSNLFDTFEIENAVPSQVFTYKFEITNYVQLENTLDFVFETSKYTGDLSKLKDIDVRIGIVGADGSVTFCDWTSLTDGTSKTDVNLQPGGTQMVVPAHSNKKGTTTAMSVGRVDLWLQIKIDEEATTPVESLPLPQYRLKFEFEGTD